MAPHSHNRQRLSKTEWDNLTQIPENTGVGAAAHYFAVSIASCDAEALKFAV
jgi:hypothetical protein